MVKLIVVIDVKEVLHWASHDRMKPNSGPPWLHACNVAHCLQPMYFVKLAQYKLKAFTKVRWLLSCIDQDQIPGQTYWGTACMHRYKLLTATVLPQDSTIKTPHCKQKAYWLLACMYHNYDSTLNCLPSAAVLTAVMHQQKPLPGKNHWCTPQWCKTCKQCCMPLIVIVTTTTKSGWFRILP